MTPELITLIGKRMLRPEAGARLLHLSKAIRAKSPMLAVEYERALQASGALENPDTTPDEREELLAALSTALGPLPTERTMMFKLRLAPWELQALRDAATAEGETGAQYVRRHLPCLFHTDP